MSAPDAEALQALRLPDPAARPRQVPWIGWYWLTTAGLLVLMAECLWLSRGIWLAEPSVRQLLTPVVALTGHALERPLLDDAWQVSRLDVTPVPTHPGSWRVRAMLGLQAGILQPLPELQLTYRDWQGRLAGRIRLAPADYLGSQHPALRRPGRLQPAGEMLRLDITVHQLPDENGHLPVFEQVDLRVLPWH